MGGRASACADQKQSINTVVVDPHLVFCIRIVRQAGRVLFRPAFLMFSQSHSFVALFVNFSSAKSGFAAQSEVTRASLAVTTSCRCGACCCGGASEAQGGNCYRGIIAGDGRGFLFIGDSLVVGDINATTVHRIDQPAKVRTYAPLL